MIIEINPDHPEPRKITRAIDALQAGGVIAYPTDTVYALGCDLGSRRGIDNLYALKRLPREQPLAFVVPDLAEVSKYAVVHDFHYRFIKHLVPGPFTFILEATREVPKLLMAKRKTVGMRIPDHAVTCALARALGRPLLTTSANVDGDDAFTDPNEIDEAFPRLELILDGGVGEVIPSTVIDLTTADPAVLREGAGMARLEGMFGRRTIV